MVNNGSDLGFGRGLNIGFMKALENEAKKDSLFADVLSDHALFSCIRKDYVSVYSGGQSLFEIRPSPNGGLRYTTNPKYLVDPDLKRPVELKGRMFDVVGLKFLMSQYKGRETLKRMKRAARPYEGDERRGVQAIVLRHCDVVDIEAAFGGAASAPRIDIVCLEELNNKIHLRFWEAKLFANKELRRESDKDAPVVAQIETYKRLLNERREAVIAGYRQVVLDLYAISGWVKGARISARSSNELPRVKICSSTIRRS